MMQRRWGHEGGTAAQTALLIFTSKITKTQKITFKNPPLYKKKEKIQNVENEIKVLKKNHLNNLNGYYLKFRNTRKQGPE